MKIDERINLMVGDCAKSMRTMDDQSVQTCVTSPPYFGLRDYGRDGQIGLEQKPEEYVSRLVDVFREVRRVLADDGTLWLNLGDSYASYRRDAKCVPNTLGGGQKSMPTKGASNRSAQAFCNTPIKNKDLIGIPWRVAFALQADGWYLRQDIIWHKPNPMPESVRDRCTKAHEYIFLLTKSAQYYFDHDAIKESATGRQCGNKQPTKSAKTESQYHRTSANLHKIKSVERRNRRSVWSVSTKPYKGAHFATFPPDLIEPCVLAGSRPGDTVLDPFGGSGTTAGVALKHDRLAAICELNPEYADLIPDRVKQVFPHVDTPSLKDFL